MKSQHQVPLATIGDRKGHQTEYGSKPRLLRLKRPVPCVLGPGGAWEASQKTRLVALCILVPISLKSAFCGPSVGRKTIGDRLMDGTMQMALIRMGFPALFPQPRGSRTHGSHKSPARASPAFAEKVPEIPSGSRPSGPSHRAVSECWASKSRGRKKQNAKRANRNPKRK